MTAKFLRVEKELGEPLAAWIERHRMDGMGWQWLAIELTRVTGVMVDPGELEQWRDATAHSVTYRADPFDLLG